MRYSTCKKKCHQHEFSSKEPAIALFLVTLKKYTGIEVKTCEEFCQYYTVFLDVGEMLFGNMWKLKWRKLINAGKMKVYKCLHCNELYELRSSTEHIMEFIVQNKILDKAEEEC